VSERQRERRESQRERERKREKARKRESEMESERKCAISAALTHSLRCPWTVRAQGSVVTVSGLQPVQIFQGAGYGKPRASTTPHPPRPPDEVVRGGGVGDVATDYGDAAACRQSMAAKVRHAADGGAELLQAWKSWAWQQHQQVLHADYSGLVWRCARKS
jgi:hypothetical protein